MIEKSDNSTPKPIEKKDAILKKKPIYSKNEEKLLNLIAE
jgi:hypothetical protein